MSGMPHGGGKEVLLVDGLSFNGNFKHGKKHGRGYITNSNLDTLYCEFIEDEICGIWRSYSSCLFNFIIKMASGLATP